MSESRIALWECKWDIEALCECDMLKKQIWVVQIRRCFTDHNRCKEVIWVTVAFLSAPTSLTILLWSLINKELLLTGWLLFWLHYVWKPLETRNFRNTQTNNHVSCLPEAPDLELHEFMLCTATWLVQYCNGGSVVWFPACPIRMQVSLGESSWHLLNPCENRWMSAVL